MKLHFKPKGFTLIELLVVIAIIGLLSTLAVVALNNARAKSRDAKRVSDIKQMQTALELYFVDNNKYPTAASAVELGTANYDVLCNVAAGFVAGAGDCTDGATVYMGTVPSNPSPSGAAYSYLSANGTSYSIGFNIENATGQLTAGTHTASPSGIE